MEINTQNLGEKIKGKLKQLTGRIYNMHTHPAEQHYFELYFSHIRKHLTPPSKILDIGCQYGRFTIPLANDGFIVDATDIRKKYFDFIKKQISAKAQVNFHKEKIQQTIVRQQPHTYDAILCLELLYNLPESDKLLSGLKKLLREKGLLITSHRSIGYYVYQFIKEKKFDELNLVIQGKHPDYNCQTPEQLIGMYNKAGYEIIDLKPIGMFSGYTGDPFTNITNPGKLSKTELKQLNSLEQNAFMQSLFMNNARYTLVISKLM